MKKIKKIFVYLGLMVLLSTSYVYSQSTAVVNIADILENMEDYKNAQAQLDKLAEQWQQEVNAEFEKIRAMYNKYEAEEVLLSEQERKSREDEIIQKEREVREMQKLRFGPEGDLFKKRQQRSEEHTSELQSRGQIV